METSCLFYKSSSYELSHTLFVWSEMHNTIIMNWIALNYLLRGTLSELRPPKRKSLSSPMGVSVCHERSLGFSPLILILGETKENPKFSNNAGNSFGRKFLFVLEPLWVFSQWKNRLNTQINAMCMQGKSELRWNCINPEGLQSPQGKWY